MEDEETAVISQGFLNGTQAPRKTFAFFLQVKCIKYERAWYVRQSEICIEASTWCFRREFY